MSLLVPRPIDPFLPLRDGRYVDEVVVVQSGEPVPERSIRTPHFSTWYADGRVHLAHHLPAERIDNDLAGLLSSELFDLGWLSGNELFERLLTGVVLSSAPDAETAWELFYRNTQVRLDHLEHDAEAHGSLAAFAPVYRHTLGLVHGSTVLELGACFGFLSLRIAAAGGMVTASDVSANTVRLLAFVAPRLGLRLDTLICDAARVPRASASYDTVLAVHLLEHLEPEHGAAVIAEMQRLAIGRVVIAVPFETEPTAAFGHVRVFGIDDLHRIGAASGWPFQCYEHHGGWLVLDRPVTRPV